MKCPEALKSTAIFDERSREFDAVTDVIGKTATCDRSTGIEQRLGTADLLFGRYVLLRKGKKSYAALRCAPLA